MKLLVDINLSPRWIPFLAQHGFESVHWSKRGPVMAADTEIMDLAKAVQIQTQDVLPMAIGHLVVNSLIAARPYLEAGALVTIDPMKHRIRLLPI